MYGNVHFSEGALHLVFRYGDATYKIDGVAMDVIMGFLAVLLNIKEGYTYGLQLAKAGGLYLLSGRYCPTYGPQRQKHTQDVNLRNSMVMTGTHPISLWVCPGLHKSLHYGQKENWSWKRS